MGQEHESDKDRVRQSRTNLAFCVFLVIAAFFLITEHRAHLTGWFAYWPYLLLLACPLMHLFMHGDHGHGGHGSSEPSNRAAKDKE